MICKCPQNEQDTSHIGVDIRYKLLFTLDALTHGDIFKCISLYLHGVYIRSLIMIMYQLMTPINDYGKAFRAFHIRMISYTGYMNLMSNIFNYFCIVNLLCPIDTICWHRSKSILVQKMVVAWWHQAITWTKVDYFSVRSCSIYTREISVDMLKISILE